MEWLVDLLREPAVELLNLGATALVAVLAARIRAKQRRAHDVLRHDGVLPPKP